MSEKEITKLFGVTQFGITVLVLIAANTTPNAYLAATLYALVLLRLLAGIGRDIMEARK